MDLAAAFTLAGVLALTWKVVSTLKYLTNRRWGDVVTQLVTWVGCLIVLLLAGEARVLSDVPITDSATLASLDLGSRIYLALFVGSGASIAYDLRKAIDNADSAAEPALVPKT